MAEKLTKKQKKASEFRTKKRKLDDSIPDVPEEDTAENAAKEEGAMKDETKAKKQKTDAKDTNTPSPTTEATADGKKKRRRGKGSKEGETEAAAATTEGETKAAPKAKPANQKFIVFVGNLPFNITKEQLQKHFESCTNITSIRVQTDKVTGKGKGFAFLELGTAEAMQKALYFNKTLIKERPINVELTAGGGGNKSASRKQKIAEKNEALNEERRKVHEKHIAPAKEAKSSYAAANPPVVQKAVKTIKKPHEISGANSITVDGLAARLRKA
ncbi:hypothetical protein BG006_002963 [Podila minutissima]|uniref:RRM domain-containing protein n=1 Tax=Podila minutissima TaxID=64525 RepID=A0A9P5SQD8_9FUNG|nr:hypothetical protein BG006_002963 [Podila minutissima]